MHTARLIALVALVVCLSARVAQGALEFEIQELVGYTVVDVTAIPGSFEGADFDKVVKLENGMLFEFRDYSYAYSYRPTVAIFARTYSVQEMRELGLREVPSEAYTSYKILVESSLDWELYDVNRLR